MFTNDDNFENRKPNKNKHLQEEYKEEEDYSSNDNDEDQ
jgi:hypothetical protein